MSTIKNKLNGELRDIAIDKALRHVVFDGWSNVTLDKVCLELSLSGEKSLSLFPRGALDLALSFHERDDEQFLKDFLVLESNNPSQRIRDRIECAINYRLEIAQKNKEAVKRSIALFTTPLYFSQGSVALWNTSDKIWKSIGDSSYDLNWYSKRLVLSSVYSAVLVFWLEDDSANFVETRDFVGRRIDDVMRIERIKGAIKKAPLLGKFVERFESFAEAMLDRRESFPGWQRK